MCSSINYYLVIEIVFNNALNISTFYQACLNVSTFHMQVVEDGYEFFADRQLVTIFSAPNYCGEFDNAGAMMSVDETLMCSFQILKPADKKPKFGFGSSTSSKAGTASSGVSSFGSTTTVTPGSSPAAIKVFDTLKSIYRSFPPAYSISFW